MRSLTSVLDGMFFDLPLYARIIIIAVFLTLAAVFSYKKRFLTISGVITSIVLGFIVFYIGGVSGVAVFLFFFVSASMLSLLSDGKNTVAEKTGRRDMMQVIANGVPAALMLVLYGITHNPVFIGAFAAAIAEAEADTAASSIGMLSSRPPISAHGRKGARGRPSPCSPPRSSRPPPARRGPCRRGRAPRSTSSAPPSGPP